MAYSLRIEQNGVMKVENIALMCLACMEEATHTASLIVSLVLDGAKDLRHERRNRVSKLLFIDKIETSYHMREFFFSLPNVI